MVRQSMVGQVLSKTRHVEVGYPNQQYTKYANPPLTAVCLFSLLQLEPVGYSKLVAPQVREIKERVFRCRPKREAASKRSCQ